MRLHIRLAVAAAALALEKTVLSLFVDSAAAQRAQGLGALVHVGQHAGFRFLVSFAIAVVLFAYLRGGRELAEADAAGAAAGLRPRWLAVHCAFLVPLVPLSMSLYGDTRLPFWLLVSLWVLCAGVAAAALFATLAPWAVWRRAARALGGLWWYAGLAAAGSVIVIGSSQSLWTSTARVTFEVVYRVLQWVIPGVRIDPTDLIIDTGRFAVSVAPVCSGLEGMGLMLVFCSVLLLLFRRDYFFPRALILIPAALLLSFLLNVVRIAALVLIGHGGYPDVAVYGFHSQAGWIGFNAAAAGIALVSLRSPWLTRSARERSADGAADNPTAVYLLPFLALLLAGMVSRAASGGFETFYALRLVALAVALGYSWPRLRGIDWRFTWRGPLAGALAAIAWLLAARLLLQRAGMPPALAGLAPLSRQLWIGAHLAVSLLAVPIAEELAFRGYLLRRLHAVDFEALAPRSAGGWPLLVSSLAFGLCHGGPWVASTVAGLIFGWVFIRTERLGEALAAHASASALLAVCVLAGSQWQLW
jgi:exosortase E/protease (VPEID-CTERM system)